MILKSELIRQISDHYARIKTLQNSSDPFKNELIALLSKEYQFFKQQLQEL